MSNVDRVDEGWIELSSGNAFTFQNVKPEQIQIEDIAHALGNLCRFGGHSHKFYSVAEHSVLLSRFIWYERGTKDALLALLHDASEAYLVDMPRPIKHDLPQYKTLEAKIEQAILNKFGFKYPLPVWMKEYDNRMLATEKKQTMLNNKYPWVTDNLEVLDIELEFWTPDVAKIKFLERFKALTQ